MCKVERGVSRLGGISFFVLKKILRRQFNGNQNAEKS